MPLGGEYRILAEPKGQAGLHNPAAQHLRDVAQFGSAPALGAGCRRFKSCRPDHICGRSSSVEPQPSKLMRRVRLPSPAPETQQARSPCGPGLFPAAGRGSNPVPGAELRKRASVSQRSPQGAPAPQRGEHAARHAATPSRGAPETRQARSPCGPGLFPAAIYRRRVVAIHVRNTLAILIGCGKTPRCGVVGYPRQICPPKGAP